MLLHSEPLSFESAASAADVERAPRSAAAEWRESTLPAAARAAGILGWTVRLTSGRLVVRARIAGQNGFLPHFVGQLRGVPTGCVLDGQLRLSWLPRVFMLLWLTLAGAAPLITLIEPIPGAGTGEHMVTALFMLVPAIGFFALGFGGREEVGACLRRLSGSSSRARPRPQLRRHASRSVAETSTNAEADDRTMELRVAALRVLIRAQRDR